MKQMTNLKRSLSLALCALLLAAAALGTTGCSSNSDNSNSSSDNSSFSASAAQGGSSAAGGSLPDSSAAGAADAAGAEVLGEGETVFPLTVTDGEGKSAAYQIRTDETTVGAALQALGLIEGEEGAYGLYVKTVCGITADYDADGSYWAFYIDGEYASTGVDSTEIVPGCSYALRVEQG